MKVGEKERKRGGVFVLCWGNMEEVLGFCHVGLSSYLCFWFLDERITNGL